MKFMDARKGALLSLCLLAMMTGAGTGTGFCKEAPAGGIAKERAVAAPVSAKETVEATLKSQRGILINHKILDVVRHELRRAKAGWGPSVDVVGRAGFSQLSDTTTRPLNADNDMYGASRIGLTLTQPLWDGFATRSRVRTGEATVDSMTYRVLDNATSFALDALIAHVDLLRRREILELARANVAQHEKILVSEEVRARMGAATSAEVSQTQGRLARAMGTLTDAEASLREGEASYIRLTGKPVPDKLEEVDVPLSLYPDYDATMQVAQKNNPKLKAYMADIRASRGEKELAESTYHPNINLEVGPSNSDRRGPGNHWESGFDAMLVMRWNLFNSGADKAGVKAAESRTRMSTETMYNFVDELALEIENTSTRYLAAKDQRKYYEEAMSYNTATRDAYLAQFELGERSLLDVLDSENELFNSSTQYATANGNVVVGAYRLYALTGMLLPELGIKEDPLYEVPQKQTK